MVFGFKSSFVIDDDIVGFMFDTHTTCNESIIVKVGAGSGKCNLIFLGSAAGDRSQLSVSAMLPACSHTALH